MKKKKKTASQPGFQIGTSYLLVIFIILCLVTFAALSLSSALRDRSYTQKVADHQTAYAEASSQASRQLADIDQALGQTDPVTSLEALEDVTVSQQEDGLQIDYQIPVTDSQQLEITVIADPDAHTRRVVRWKEAARSGWEEKTTLPVLGSDTDN